MSEAAMVLKDQINFKQKRLSYKITLEELAKRTKLSMTTISAYERFTGKYTETRTRDSNAALIENALNDIIQERIAEAFPNAVNHSEKEDKVVEEVKELTYSRSLIRHKIQKYCKLSKITMNQFTEMCGVSNNIFAPSTIGSHPEISKRCIDAILNATGWPEEYLTDSDDIPVNAAVLPVKTHKNETNLISEGPVDKIFDEKFICQDGKYFREYKCIYIRKEELTMEQFIESIKNQKEEN